MLRVVTIALGIDGAIEPWILGEVSRATAEAIVVRLTIAGTAAVAQAEEDGLYR